MHTYSHLQKKYDEALATVQKAIHLFPSQLSLWLRLNQLLVAQIHSSRTQNTVHPSLLSTTTRTLFAQVTNQLPGQNFTKRTHFWALSPASSTNNSERLRQEHTLQRMNVLSECLMTLGRESFIFPSTKDNLNISSAHAQRAIHANPGDVRAYLMLAVNCVCVAKRDNSPLSWQTADAAVTVALQLMSQAHTIQKQQQQQQQQTPPLTNTRVLLLFLLISQSEVQLALSLAEHLEELKSKRAIASLQFAKQAVDRAGEDKEWVSWAWRQLGRCYNYAPGKVCLLLLLLIFVLILFDKFITHITLK